MHVFDCASNIFLPKLKLLNRIIININVFSAINCFLHSPRTLACEPGIFPEIRLGLKATRTGPRTLARNFSNIDFFLQILPLKDDELVM